MLSASCELRGVTGGGCKLLLLLRGVSEETRGATGGGGILMVGLGLTENVRLWILRSLAFFYKKIYFKSRFL